MSLPTLSADGGRATDERFASIAQAALRDTGSASVAIFTLGADGSLHLASAAGIASDPLRQLMAAVQNPAHPIARTALDGEVAFDATPIAPGGPALRSHVPMIDGHTGTVVGVLALAHQEPLSSGQRDRAKELAARAAALA